MDNLAPYLEVVDGPMKGTQFRLLGTTAVIGRAPECDIRLDEVKGVSRQHAQIIIQESRLHVRDLGSQNGLQVDGKRVSEASVPSGSKIKIGQATLRVFIPDPGSAVPATAQGGAPQPAQSERGRSPATAKPRAVGSPRSARPPEQALDAETMLQAAGEKSRSFLAMTAFVVVLIAALLYLANAMLNAARPPAPKCWVMTAGQEAVIAIPRDFDEHEVSGATGLGAKLISVEPYKGMLAAAVKKMNQFNAKNRYLTIRFLVVHAHQIGDAAIRLKRRSGQVLASLDILVRGNLPPVWEEPQNPGEARDQADRLCLQARTFQEDGEIYLAIRHLERASKLYGRCDPPDKSNQTWTLAQRLQGELAAELSSRFENALALAFPDPNARQAPNLRAAYQQLFDLKHLVPDENCLEWQILHYWQSELDRLHRSRR